ncbi:MAG: TonB-dependent receptor, partial [Parahaliea sp.]
WSANLSADYSLVLADNLELRGNLSMNFSDAFYTAQDLDPITRQGAFTKFDVRIALASLDERWSIALIGKNITDERTSSWINDFTLNGFPGRQNSYQALLDPPRTIGVQAMYRF